MSARRSRQHRGRLTGAVPRLGRGLAATGRWTIRHPQPALLVVVACVAVWALWGYAQQADAFRVEHVFLPPNSALRLRAPIIGENLWALDVRALADDLKQQAPWLKEIRVVRQMPNAVWIETVPRLAVAQVRLDRWYPVDREGFILPEGRAEASGALVRLSGFDRADGLRVGKDNADERLALALRVRVLLRREAPVIARRVTDINVAEIRQLRFTLDDKTEVRCGSEAELEAHLARLRAALKVIAKQSLEARYIDVRFQEPVIGPRT